MTVTFAFDVTIADVIAQLEELRGKDDPISNAQRSKLIVELGRLRASGAPEPKQEITINFKSAGATRRK